MRLHRQQNSHISTMNQPMSKRRRLERDQRHREERVAAAAKENSGTTGQQNGMQKDENHGNAEVKEESKEQRSREDVMKSVKSIMARMYLMRDDEGSLAEEVEKFKAAEEACIVAKKTIDAVETSNEAYREGYDGNGCRTTFHDPLESVKVRKLAQTAIDGVTLMYASPFSNNGMAPSTLYNMAVTQADNTQYLAAKKQFAWESIDTRGHLDKLMQHEKNRGGMVGLVRELKLAVPAMSEEDMAREVRLMQEKYKNIKPE
ncbi:uncharacterized protein RCC_02538 [Ramularia collo-cygni]|uniref:Uncharacterized protein n=1 Tax=Ramularia collo-cygni TaxID=112498 RepID=A0A2D3V8J8_9PEZI|nr:uncharacterized protein RCC_02538 [Ramularia collo-cygni]CZT16703.1 uncharacterized protein RCC_02538 [Ramularia collo-cygni]